MFVIYHTDPATCEQGQATQEKSPLPLDSSSGLVLLKQIVEDVKAARQEAGRQDKDQRKWRCCRRLAQILDYVFFALYFLTVGTFSVYMYIEWIQSYFRDVGK